MVALIPHPLAVQRRESIPHPRGEKSFASKGQKP